MSNTNLNYKPFICEHSAELEGLRQEVKSLQSAVANIRRDIRQIIHDEILRTLDFRSRRTMPL